MGLRPVVTTRRKRTRRNIDLIRHVARRMHNGLPEFLSLSRAFGTMPLSLAVPGRDLCVLLALALTAAPARGAADPPAAVWDQKIAVA